MVDVKTVVVSVTTLLSVFLQLGIRAQQTIDDDFCSQVEDGCGFLAVENMRLRSFLESESQTTKSLENVSYSQSEEIQRLKLELKTKQQKIATLENLTSSWAEEIRQRNMELETKQSKIETLENLSRSRAEENHQLNMELENKQQKIETLENVSNARAEEINQLNMELEKKQQMIETLENVSRDRAEENHQLNMELEKKQQKIETLENVSLSQAEENHRLNMELEKKQQKIQTLENVSLSQAEENHQVNMELEKKQQKIEKLENVSLSQTEENHRLNMELEKKQQKIQTLENVSLSQTEENHQLNMELEKKQQKIETLENVSSARAEENHKLNMELENKQQKIQTLENESSSLVEESHKLNMELEIKQQRIETLENVAYTQAEENHKLNIELENKQQKIDTLVNVSNITAEEIHRLNLQLEYKQRKIEALENERRRLRTIGMQTVTATFMGSLGHWGSHHGITKVEDKIYVVGHDPDGIKRIKLYEDGTDFRFITDIAINSTGLPNDIVYSNKSKCVYIIDPFERCIWVMTTTGEHRLTKWLTSLTWPYTLSLSNEGHLLMLRTDESFSLLEIYSLEASLIRSLRLPLVIQDPRHAVQTSVGNFIILHRLNDASTGPWVISQLTNDGHLIHRFIPRNQSEKLDYSRHLSLDSDNNRLFVADRYNDRVILFDSTDLTWIEVIVSKAINGIRDPFRLFYDASKKHLFVAQYNASVIAYEIS